MDLAKLRFLVVEDHQFQRWLAETVVREAGATAVFCAADGRAALDSSPSWNRPSTSS